MRFDIQWHFFLAVTSQQKCDKTITKLADRLGATFSDVRSERYWKESETFKVCARSSFAAASPKDALDATMRTIGLFAPTWTVTVPCDSEAWEFSGTAASGSVSIPGVDFISFNASQEREPALADAV